jgi:REP element-mobilizing transposase RayT
VPFLAVGFLMSNIHRLRLDERIFFVTVRLHRGLGALGYREFEIILARFDESRCRLGFCLCGYVLMPSHWHALLWPSYPLTISRKVQDIKYLSARRFNRLRGRQAPFWQHQFWDRFVRHARELSKRLDYIHLNPVRRGLVARPENWRWSSYRNFALEKSVQKTCPIQIDYVLLSDSYRG